MILVSFRFIQIVFAVEIRRLVFSLVTTCWSAPPPAGRMPVAWCSPWKKMPPLPTSSPSPCPPMQAAESSVACARSPSP